MSNRFLSHLLWLLPLVVVLAACDISEEEAAEFKELLDMHLTAQDAFTQSVDGLRAERVVVAEEPEGYAIVIETTFKDGASPATLDDDGNAEGEAPGPDAAALPPPLPLERARQLYCPPPEVLGDYCRLGGALAPPIELTVRDWYTDAQRTTTCHARGACADTDW